MKLTNQFRATIRLLLGLRNRNLWFFISVLVPNIFAAFLEGVSFTFILFAFSSLEESLKPPLFLSFFLKWLPSSSPNQSFTLFFVLAIFLQILRSSLNYFSQIGITYLATRIQTEAQQKVYEQILSLSFPCVHRYSIGDLLEYAKTSATLVTSLLDCINRVFVALIGIFASIAVMVFLSPSLTGIALGVFGFLGISQKFIITKISRHSQQLSHHTVEFSKDTVQTLNGLRVIHTFHRQRTVMERILTNLKEIAGTTRKLNLWNHAILPINEIIGVLVVGIFLVAGQFLITHQETSVLPLLLTFVTIAYRLNVRVQVFVSSLGSAATNWGQVLRLEEILSSEGKEFIPSGGQLFQGFAESISFSQVTLQYPNTEYPAVQNLNFKILKGETVAFIGSSGAGKSSIVDLLLRLYEPTQGKILIDEQNLADYDVESWRNKLGVVSQDVFIFNQTIEENIRFGSPKTSLEKIIEATKLSGAHSFIESLGQKYNTILGEKGYRLSGGEKQRLTLARALVKDPEILILDEATSSLDSQSEKLIQTAIEHLRGVKTMFIVAHRLSTIRNADRIFVMEKGEILETGSHEHLLALCGRYAHLWELQSKKEETFRHAPI